MTYTHTHTRTYTRHRQWHTTRQNRGYHAAATTERRQNTKTTHKHIHKSHMTDDRIHIDFGVEHVSTYMQRLQQHERVRLKAIFFFFLFFCVVLVFCLFGMYNTLATESGGYFLVSTPMILTVFFCRLTFFLRLFSFLLLKSS